MMQEAYVYGDDFRRGNTHSDTVEFDDKDALSEFDPSKCKIWRVIVYHDKKLVFGVKVDYFVFEQNLIVECEKHMGDCWTDGYEETVELAEQEYIVQLFGKHGSIMDSFGIATSTGRRFSFGGQGGNSYVINPPDGHHIGYIKGGFGGHLHYIEAVPVQYKTGKVFESPKALSLQQHGNLRVLAANEQFSTFRGSYSVGKEIGRGAYGSICLGQDSKGQNVAIKKLAKNQSSSNDIEYQFCSQFNHKSIVKVIDLYETFNTTYIVFEYCSRKDLKTLCRKKSGNCLKEYRALEIFSQVLEGLREIHQKRLVHKDIKPKNILLTEDFSAKICDFGITVQEGPGITAAYDIFCWGMSLYRTVVGKWPFDPPNSLQTTMMDLARQNRPLSFPPHISSACQMIIRSTLEGEPSRRIGLPALMEQVQALLNTYRKELEKIAKTKPKKAKNGEENQTIKEDKQIISEDKQTIAEDKQMTAEDKPGFLDNGPSVVEDKQIIMEDTPGTLDNKPGFLENRPSAIEDKQIIMKDTRGSLENKQDIVEEKPAALDEKLEIPGTISNENQKFEAVILEDKHLENGSDAKPESQPLEMKNESLVKNDSTHKEEGSPMLLENEGISMNNSSQKKENSPMIPELKSNNSKSFQAMHLEYKAGTAQIDTISFSDESALAKYSKDFYKMWQLIIYHDGKTIFGFKTDYFVFGANAIVEGERWLGTGWEGGYESKLQLAADEFITTVYGRIDTALRGFSLKTSKGRQFSFGSSEGDSFELCTPKGYCFRSIRGGFGRQIHYIELEPFPIGLFHNNI